MLMPRRDFDRIRSNAHSGEIAGGEQLELHGSAFFRVERLGCAAPVRNIAAARAENRRKVILRQATAQTAQRAAQLLDDLPVGRGTTLTVQPPQLVLDERPQADHRASERLGCAIRNYPAS